MAAETSRSTGSSADSYVGSLISLTSKYEIRYEGVLYNINTEESSIGLRNVRSFGTEGRKKDGPQVLPSDKVYEYILFRGSDIKDLQVKSSPPPVQTTPPIHNDPAIIQSHYSRPPPMPTSFPPAGSGTVPDLSSHATQMGHPRSTFQGGLPLYQPGGSLGPWGTPPPPSPSGSGLAMPMYWQGFYGPANGFPPAQQPFLRPPGLALPPSMQQPMQHPGMNLSLTTMPSNQPPSSMQPPNVSEFPSPLLPPVASGALNLTSSSITPTLPSTIAAAHSAALSSETSPSLITSMPIRAPTASIPTSSLSGSLSLVSNLTTSSMDINSIVPPISDKPKTMPGPSLAYQSLSQSVSSILATSSSINPEKSTPSLVTPGQLLQRPDSAASSSSHSSQSTHKDVEVVRAPSSSKQPPSPPKEIQAPLLPLPSPLPVASDQKSGAAQQTRKTHTQSHSHNNGRNYNHSYRGRGRGRGNGYSRPITKFTEDFDFEAMNEKFNKDEVWGHLGKTNKSQLGDKAGKGEEDDGNYSNDEDEAGSLEVEVKPLYVKDDFFDSLSCNALDRGAPNGRTKFSEQLKIDTETFGDFPRHRGGRGGRGPGRGGRSRGSYHGRGYGYVGRGRGQTHSTSGRGQTHSTSGRGHANSMSGRGN